MMTELKTVDTRVEYVTDQGAISEQKYKWAWDTMINVVLDSDHPEAEEARQVLSVLAATSFDLQAELDRLNAELAQVTAAGYEATMVASNALNLEAQLTARLADAESVASAQVEIITRMSKDHAAEVTRWQTIYLRQAEVIAYLFKALVFPAERAKAARLFPDVLGEVRE